MRTLPARVIRGRGFGASVDPNVAPVGSTTSNGNITSTGTQRLLDLANNIEASLGYIGGNPPSAGAGALLGIGPSLQTIAVDIADLQTTLAAVQAASGSTDISTQVAQINNAISDIQLQAGVLSVGGAGFPSAVATAQGDATAIASAASQIASLGATAAVTNASNAAGAALSASHAQEIAEGASAAETAASLAAGQALAASHAQQPATPAASTASSSTASTPATSATGNASFTGTVTTPATATTTPATAAATDDTSDSTDDSDNSSGDDTTTGPSAPLAVGGLSLGALLLGFWYLA